MPRAAATPSARHPRGTGASYVYEQLRAEILQLDLAPGTLLDETELSRRFGVSRSPVREALIRLSAEGLVRTLRNRSSIVAFLDISEILGFFDSLDLLYRVTARRAAMAAHAADLAAIKKAAAAHSRAMKGNDAVALISTNHDFHMAIARAGNNSFYENWLKMLLDSGQRILLLYMRQMSDRLNPLAEGEHPGLVAAIEARDAAAAEEAAGRDAAITGSEILALLSDRRDRGFSVEQPARVTLAR